MKLIFGRTNLHTGVLRLLVAPQRLRRVERPPPAVNYRTSPPPCAEWLTERLGLAGQRPDVRLLRAHHRWPQDPELGQGHRARAARYSPLNGTADTPARPAAGL